MLDFTSALYLGLNHESDSLRPWEALSLGKPAALEAPPGLQAVSLQLAQLLGCERATLLPSTLHLFHDVFHAFSGHRAAVLLDAGIYPIMQWTVECARGAQLSSERFAHHDLVALADKARRCARQGRYPIVACNGFCPGCGAVAPLGGYSRIADAYNGCVVLDDTQALGILGRRPTREAPLGEDGGGSLRWCGVAGPRIAVGASLAKGFGAPLAVLAGSKRMLEWIGEKAETPIHCSPPSVPVIEAARHALHVNRTRGPALRAHLARLALRLRAWAARAGLMATSAMPFPVQPFRLACTYTALHVRDALEKAGVRALVTAGCDGAGANLTFLLTARHCIEEVDRAGRLLIATMRRGLLQRGY